MTPERLGFLRRVLCEHGHDRDLLRGAGEELADAVKALQAELKAAKAETFTAVSSYSKRLADEQTLRREVERERDDIRAKFAACVRTLEGIQWLSDANAAKSEEYGYCPDCGAPAEGGHSEDCAVGYALTVAKAAT